MAGHIRFVLMVALLSAQASCSQRPKSVPWDASVGGEVEPRVLLLTVTEELEGEAEAVGQINVMDDGSFRYRTTGLYGEAVATGVLPGKLMDSLRADLRVNLIPAGRGGFALCTVDVDRPHVLASIEALLKQVDRRYPGR